MESCSNPASRHKRFRSSKETAYDSCFSTASLVRIAKAYNTQPDVTPIPESIIHNSPRNRAQLIQAVRKAFRNECPGTLLPHHHDACILQQREGTFKRTLSKDEAHGPPPVAVDADLLKDKPWSTSEIDLAMSHVERKYPHFKFLETTPIDFALTDKMGSCVVSELCKFSIKKLVSKGYTSFGIVFNTHTHTEPGSHWICLYCCLLTGRICYYDSYGFLPEHEIITFMHTVSEQYTRMYKRPMVMLYNDYPNQTDGVECGTYCIVFLDLMAKHGNLRKAVMSIRNEKNIQTLRKQIMSPAFK